MLYGGFVCTQTIYNYLRLPHLIQRSSYRLLPTRCFLCPSAPPLPLGCIGIEYEPAPSPPTPFEETENERGLELLSRLRRIIVVPRLFEPNDVRI